MTLQQYRRKFIEQSQLIEELQEENETLTDRLAEIRGLASEDEEDDDSSGEDEDESEEDSDDE